MPIPARPLHAGEESRHVPRRVHRARLFGRQRPEGYNREGTVCGIELPEGLVNSSKLPEPIFTPSTKAEIGDHDENISFDRLVEILGEEDATALRDLALKVYTTAADHAPSAASSSPTRSSSSAASTIPSFWLTRCSRPTHRASGPATPTRRAKTSPAFDKQFVRDWLTAHWDKTGNPPRLPQDIIDATSAKYIQAYETITERRLTRARPSDPAAKRFPEATTA